MNFPVRFSAFAFLSALWFSGDLRAEDTTADAVRPEIPEELLDDEHVREEFGINDFTAPSIEKIFDDLAVFGKLPYDEVKRPITKKIPRERIALSLSMGRLIAEGFLVVQAEKIEPLEDIGRALLKQAKVLGTGRRVTAHASSLLEKSVLGQWGSLKDELSATQVDVEAELLLLRDVEVAHLLSLGGWLRAFEMATIVTASDYTPEKARGLTRSEVVEYFLFSLEGLHPDLQETPIVVALRDGLTTIQKKNRRPSREGADPRRGGGITGYRDGDFGRGASGLGVSS